MKSSKNLCMEAFDSLCTEVEASGLATTEECQYWVFERGFRAAMQTMIEVAKTGKKTHEFASEDMQMLMEKLVRNLPKTAVKQRNPVAEMPSKSKAIKQMHQH